MPDKMAASSCGEVETPVKQCITVLDKKIRNLEKRKGKLDTYRKSLGNGELNKDQQEAIAKYDVVLQNIEFAKELHKQFLEISADTEKLQKKQAKREKVERHQQELARLQDLLVLNGVLNVLGNENVREDFRAGKNTCLILTDENLQLLDEFYQLIFPTRDVDLPEQSFAEQLSAASEHLVSYLDHQDKKVLSTTYKELHELIDRINSCDYFDKNSRTETAEVQQTAENVAEGEQYEEPFVKCHFKKNSPEVLPTQTKNRTIKQHGLQVLTKLWKRPAEDYKVQIQGETIPKTAEVNAEDDGLEASPTSVEPTNNICGGGGGGTAAGAELVVDPSLTTSHVPAQPDPYHSTQWSHSPVLVNQQPSVMAPSISATTGVIAMTTAHVERSQACGFTEGAYYSSFTKQRPLQEIVSSLQGSYNFLQESQIDLEGHAQGQQSSSEGIVYNAYDNQSGSGQSMPPFSSQQQQSTLGPQSTLDQSTAALHASQTHFDHDTPSAPPAQIYHSQGATAGAYGVQGLHHNVYGHHQMALEPGYDPNYGQMDKTQYNFMDQQAFVLTQLNPSSDPPAHVPSLNVASSAGPQPIPLPNQAIHGQSLTDQGFSAPQQQAPDITEAMSKKQFTMNPNADIFRSVYDESSASAAEPMKPELPPQGAGDGQAMRTFAQTASANYQGGGATRGFGSFGSGGPPRGSSVSRGGRGGGRDAALNNGVQSGGKGGPSNVSRGGVPNMGSNGQRGGMRGGPPRGGNSGMRGSGGRGGGGGGFSRNSSQQSSHEQATHA